MNDARDPYVGINQHIRAQAKSQLSAHYAVGTVLSVAPLRVRADGLDLDKEDLKIAQHLTTGWVEQLTGLSWSVTVSLPERTLEGTCVAGAYSGTCSVTRPAEELAGHTAAAASITHTSPLSAGDLVLLIPSDDGQLYYLVDKLVEVDA